ncbi:MAG: hypothetical protein J6A23_06510 [Thermoguttaceae bacterium]|nr:hypothetical protein [Thermoguttaceae bacterium]MBP3695599.1 hypothetical protein [Thermoguttaceae bacterium]
MSETMKSFFSIARRWLGKAEKKEPLVSSRIVPIHISVRSITPDGHAGSDPAEVQIESRSAHTAPVMKCRSAFILTDVFRTKQTTVHPN